MLKRLQIITTFSLMAMVALTSCSDNATSVHDNPPPVPPEQSMAMDFSNFDTQNRAKYATTQTSTHFGQALVRGAVLKTIVDVNLAIPRVLLHAAANADARLTEDGQWKWNYSKSTESQEYGVQLVATADGEGTINWQFKVTNSELGVANQLFFSGTSNLDGTEGTWTYYDPKNTNEKEAVSEITWTVNGEDQIELRLEVLSDRNDHAGDYIEYTFDGSFKTAVYHDASKNEDVELHWNVDTHAGYMIAPDYNGGEKACWDANLQNTTCRE